MTGDRKPSSGDRSVDPVGDGATSGGNDDSIEAGSDAVGGGAGNGVGGGAGTVAITDGGSDLGSDGSGDDDGPGVSPSRLGKKGVKKGLKKVGRRGFKDVSRRGLLKLGGGLGLLAAGTGLALDWAEDGEVTVPVSLEEARRLAERYAPTIYFGRREQWYPTDPRLFAAERGGETVVDGFDALDGYTKRRNEQGSPPAPTAFFRAVEYQDSPLAVVQFWFYSAFDQFSTNFHWHDWEVLHVFVDRSAGSQATGEPVLFVASAHAREVPNNEYLDPGADRASILSEVGSHSSALGVNDDRERFQRYDTSSLVADVTNHALDVSTRGQPVPLAYGLPRDEGWTLPYAVPEVDGAPVYEHDRLPNVGEEDLLPADITVRDGDALATPPADLPTRESDARFVPAGLDVRPAAGDDGASDENDTGPVDHEYGLVPLDDLRHLDRHTGPQLSFEFPIPNLAEELVDRHLTVPPLPWEQTRFRQPAVDITDPEHREALAGRYGVVDAGIDHSALVGAAREVTSADAAPTSSGVTLEAATSEVLAVLQSEPTVVPSFAGVVAVVDPPAGDHRLTVGGAGLAPYREAVTVEADAATQRIGVDGEIGLSPERDAVAVRGGVADGLERLTVEDDFAGRVYDGRPPAGGGFEVFVHRDGAYTASVTDRQGRTGAVRINPDAADDEVSTGAVRTGTVALTDYLRRILTETRNQAAVYEDGTEDGITEVATGTDVEEADVEEAEDRAEREVGGGDGDGDGDETGDGDGTADGDGTEAEDSETDSGGSDASETDGEGSGGDGSETDADETETTTEYTTTTAEESGDGAVGTSSADATRTTTETGASTGTETPTETESETSSGSGSDGSGDSSSGATGSAAGLEGLLRALDAALLAAARAHRAAEEGSGEATTRNLRRLETRLGAIVGVIDRSDLPDDLDAMVRNRVRVMRGRVDTALESTGG